MTTPRVPAPAARPALPVDSDIHAVIGAAVREHRTRRGISQRSLGKLVHVSGDLIARIERAERRANPTLLDRIDEVLVAGGEIRGLVRAGGTRGPGTAPAVHVVVQGPEASCDGDEVKRREFLAAAVSLGLAGDIWDRLQSAIDAPRSGGEVVTALHERTAWLFRAQDRMPTAAMAELVRAHLDQLSGALSATPERRPLLVLAGQASALAGWMAFDTGDPVAARHHYATAMRAAHEAGHPPVAALALTYASYAERDPLKAVLLLDAAEAQAGTAAAGRFRGWLHARRAEELARAGDAARSLAAVARARAEYAADPADPAGLPAWLEFLSAARLESMAVGALTTLRHPEAVPAAVAAQAAILDSDRKTRAVIFGDVATAHLVAGDVAECQRVALLALTETLSGQASLGRQRLVSLAHRLRMRGGRAESFAGDLVAALA